MVRRTSLSEYLYGREGRLQGVCAVEETYVGGEVGDAQEEIVEERAAPNEQSRPAAEASEGQHGPRRRYVGRAKVCAFCTGNIAKIDYKDHEMLRRFLTERAKIRPRR